MKPFLAPIKERYCLNPHSDKKTFHIVLDLVGSGIQYQVGDCLGIYPVNHPKAIQRLLEHFNANGEEVVQSRKGESFSAYAFLLKHANLDRLPKEPCENIEEFCRQLPPMLPRFYSIASSMECVTNEAHLTIALAEHSPEAFGLCSDYLCNRVPIGSAEVSLFHKESAHFNLPKESIDKPIIMIGPGTGVAPFRGFMQARVSLNASPKNWLFFGERHKTSDFYYQNDWEHFKSAGKLQLDCAFSRDQREKIYVQHLMLRHKKQLWQWLEHEGAYLYVCGDASKMAKDVDQTLLQIVQSEGNLEISEAKVYLRNLRKNKRYQRDVY